MPVDQLYAPVADAVAAAARRRAARPVVLVDGRSGSGKTSFATLLAPALDAELVRLDDLYPGWDGLAAGAAAVVQDVLGRGSWTRWDWQRGEPAEEHALDERCPLVVDGCGALSGASRAIATLGVWVACPDDVRKRRALARDGEAYARHWDRWAAQEAAFIARERPHELAEVLLTEDPDGRLTVRFAN